jgi:hypothetical protein
MHSAQILYGRPQGCLIVPALDLYGIRLRYYLRYGFVRCLEVVSHVGRTRLAASSRVSGGPLVANDASIFVSFEATCPSYGTTRGTGGTTQLALRIS